MAKKKTVIEETVVADGKLSDMMVALATAEAEQEPETEAITVTVESEEEEDETLWVVDGSHYNNLSRAQMRTLQEHGCAGFIGKLCQGNYKKDALIDQHVNNCLAIGMPYALYQWVDPIYNIQSQVDYLMTLLEGYDPAFVAADMEQYWMSWQEWWVRKTTGQGHVRVFNDYSLHQKYREYMLKAKQALDVPLVIYSAKWYVDGYNRTLASVIGEVDHYWNARYFGWADDDKDKIMDWPEFEKFLKKVKNPAKSELPRGVYKWSMWQVNSLPLEGMPVLDVNIIKGPEYDQLFLNKPIPEPQPPAEGKKIKLRVIHPDWVNIRTSPKVLPTNDVGDLPHGTVIGILNITGQDAWIEFEPGRFAAFKVGDKQYLEVIEDDSE